jgi:hypothetical protein
MSVTFVAGSTFAYAFGTASIDLTTPAGIQAGDRLLAAVHGGFAISGPSGWTKVSETAIFAEYGTDQRLAVFAKDSVTAGDSSQTFSFTQASEGAMAVVCAVTRGASSVAYSTTTSGSVNSYAITPSTVTATSNDSLILIFASSVLWPPGPIGSGLATPAPPASFTLTSGTALAEYNLAAAYRIVGNGVSNSGAFNFQPTGGTPAALYGSNNNLGAVTILMTPSGGGGATTGRAASPGPLGAGAAVARHIPRAGRALAPSPLGAALVDAFHNFSAAVEGRPLVYVVDLDTLAGRVRVPISSWQATLQTEQSNYLQVVIPACEPFLAQINAATRVRVSRRCVLLDGTAFEYQMAAVPLQTVTTARGPNNYTATLSGYSAGSVLSGSPPLLTARTLTDVRTIFTAPGGLRVRCAIDWLLRPGQIAFVNSAPFVVAYINYYVSDGDQYMDVGERVEPT